MLEAVARQADGMRETMRFVHDHPELGHEKCECSHYLCEILAAGGLDVEQNVAGMDSAFCAVLRGTRPGGDRRLA